MSKVLSSKKYTVIIILLYSLADPDPTQNVPDPHVFGLAGSGSLCDGKLVITTFIPTATSLALKCTGTFISKKAKTLLKNFFMIIQTLSEK